MPASLSNDLLAQLQGAPTQKVARQLGVEPAQANAAIGAALPLLLGALGRNASQPQGAQALFGALQKDHAGLDLGGLLGSVLGGGGQGGQILGHVFGDRQQNAAQGLGAATGLGSDGAQSLLKILAPIVMAYLAKRMFSQSDGAQQASPDVLGQVLGQEHAQIRQQGGAGGGLLGAVLDQDGDGQLGLGDLLKMGGGLLGGKR